MVDKELQHCAPVRFVCELSSRFSLTVSPTLLVLCIPDWNLSVLPLNRVLRSPRIVLHVLFTSTAIIVTVQCPRTEDTEGTRRTANAKCLFTVLLLSDVPTGWAVYSAHTENGTLNYIQTKSSR